MGNLKCNISVFVLFACNGILAIDGDSFDCDFDDGFCNWKQDKTDDFDWTRRSGETPTVGTGPNSDHTSGEGFYVYIETTKTNANYTARLISPQKGPGQYCFSFWYHMYGSHINRLSVSKKEGTNTKELFWKTGNQGEKWIFGQIQFEAEEIFQIVIEGKARNHRNYWFGDIAVDDIVIFPTEKCPTDCGDPTPEAGVANSTNIKIGSAVQISCKPGYKILGNSSVFCLVNGSWSDRSECHPTDCMMPTFHSGIIINTLEGTTYNMTAELSCVDGFTLIGNAYVTCQADGNWTMQPYCVINNCSDPTPESGNVDDKNFQYGSVIEVTCIEGYKISGNSSIICQANSTWSNIPVCYHIDCGTMKITNGHFNTAAGTTFGKTATQSCDTGYTFAGDETVTCLEAGWNGTIATCTIVDPESSALIAVYVTVPLVVFVTIMLTLVVCRKGPLKCSKASGAQQGENMNPVIQETMETNNVVNEYEHLNSNTMQTGTGGSALPGNEYAVLSDTENDEVVHVYSSIVVPKSIDKSDDKLGYENVKSFASPFGGMSENTVGANCEPNGDETPIQLYECLKTDTQNENDCYDLLNKN